MGLLSLIPGSQLFLSGYLNLYRKHLLPTQRHWLLSLLPSLSLLSFSVSEFLEVVGTLPLPEAQSLANTPPSGHLRIS